MCTWDTWNFQLGLDALKHGDGFLRVSDTRPTKTKHKTAA